MYLKLKNLGSPVMWNEQKSLNSILTLYKTVLGQLRVLHHHCRVQLEEVVCGKPYRQLLSSRFLLDSELELELKNDKERPKFDSDQIQI